MMNQLKHSLRYYLRGVIYKNAWLRHIALHGATRFTREVPDSTKDYWDSVLGGRFKTGLAAMVEIDGVNAMSVLIRLLRPAMLAVHWTLTKLVQFAGALKTLVLTW